MHDDIRDPVPALAREILDLYRGPLTDVRFPDLDRAILETAEAELIEAQRTLEAAERALEAARAVVAERTATLTAKAQRGLSYAKVFTEDQPELRERVTAIAALASVVRRAEPARDEAAAANAPKKRGRPRKIREEDGGAPLFADGAPSTDLEVDGELADSEAA
ncbi:hypothetical protein [Sandaracinus amylolyticus]|uniref:Uncharacterized protein n=1 Tax=Sandaracinus amylolyticus TaxID=927083 RepID=A0A0F6W7S9_9BACT|nr:hypothetical protein [Sandaracinus amylolyticus]AKF09471.1 hypothetical protein DB32_006620 [Sandaracinus amylolyticus]